MLTQARSCSKVNKQTTNDNENPKVLNSENHESNGSEPLYTELG